MKVHLKHNQSTFKGRFEFQSPRWLHLNSKPNESTFKVNIKPKQSTFKGHSKTFKAQLKQN